MGENTEQIVFDVILDASKVEAEMNRLGEETDKLKEQQKSLNEMYKRGEITFAEYTKMLANNKNQVRDNEKQVKGLSAQLKALNDDTNKYASTLNGERAKLRDMQAAYAALDKEQRESKGGKKFLSEINEQSEKVKKLEKGIGDTRRNVGNYTEAIKAAGIGTGSFGAKLKAFMLNPWAIMFRAIVVAVTSLVHAFRASEERTKALEVAIAPLKGALTVVQNIFRSIAEYLTKYVVVAFQKVADGIGWVARTIDTIGKRFGKDFGLAAALDDMISKTDELTKSRQALTDRERKWIVEEAKINREIASLQADIADKQNLSVEERLKLLDKVEKLERQKAQTEKSIAQERLRLLELDASRSDNDAEANENLARAKAEVINKDAALEQAMRGINKQRAQLLTQLEALGKAEEAAADKSQANAEKAAQNEIKLRKSNLDLWLATEQEKLGKENEWTAEAYYLMQQYYDSLLSLYEQDSIDYNNVLIQKANYDAQYTERHRKEQEKQAKDAEDAAKRERQAKQSAYMQTLGAARGVTQALSELIDADVKNTEDAAKKKKALAITELIVDQASAAGSTAAATAAAIDGATKAAAQTGIAAPFTAPAFIAEMVGIVAGAAAQVFAGIIQARQILSSAGNFADGGVIGGYTSAPSRIDNTYAHVSTGEMVLNAKQQKQLFEAANGAFAMGSGIDYDALAQAIASMPAPVMDYSEFITFEKHVSTYNEIAKI